MIEEDYPGVRLRETKEWRVRNQQNSSFPMNSHISPSEMTPRSDSWLQDCLESELLSLPVSICGMGLPIQAISPHILSLVPTNKLKLPCGSDCHTRNIPDEGEVLKN